MAEPSDVERSSRTRTGFGPVVLAGLATAGLAAVAGSKPWVAASGGGPGRGNASMLLDQGATYPVASAVALVLLAAWGVLLVTRGSVRRVFAWLTVLAALGLLAAVVAGYLDLRDSVSTYDQLIGRSAGKRGFTGWFWTSVAASVLALGPATLAVRRVSTWPEMGRRYDAPGSGAPPEVSAGAEPTDRDLWTELDRGHDPTAD